MGTMSFLSGVAPTEQGGYKDDDGAGFDEEFAAVEPIDGVMLKVGIGEQGVPEESNGA